MEPEQEETDNKQASEIINEPVLGSELVDILPVVATISPNLAVINEQQKDVS